MEQHNRSILPHNEEAFRTVRVTRDRNGQDATPYGAFPSDSDLRISLRAERTVGIREATLEWWRDGCDANRVPLPYVGRYGEEDCFSCVLPLSRISPESGALFFYRVIFFVGDRTYHSDTPNNVDVCFRTDAGQPFLLLAYDPSFDTPRWFGASVMYHIFVDRFYGGSHKVPKRADARLNPDWENGTPEYAPYPGAPLKNNEFFGGTLWGIVEKLNYLASLGVGTLYLSPIFRAYSNHKYDTGDYGEIDEMFGGEAAFSHLLEEAEKRGMHVILDGVFNHTGDDSLYFNKYGKYPSVGAYGHPESPYRGWYRFSEGETYAAWWGIPILPQLNHENAVCRSYFTGDGGIVAKYLRQGISGWRLDVADELSDEFLDELRVAAKKAKPDALILGEVWENAADKVAYSRRRRYLRGAQLDSVMNYPFKNAVIEYVRSGDAAFLYHELTQIYASYPRPVSDSLMNLLGTHDTARILTVLGAGDSDGRPNDELAHARLNEEQYEHGKRLLKIASALQYTVYGTPSVFYGDEVGTEGYGDPFCRRPFPWHRMDEDLLSHYRRLGQIRHENPAFDHGDFRLLPPAGGLLCFYREKGDCRILVAANASDVGAPLALDGCYTDLLTGAVFQNETAIPAYGVRILKLITNKERQDPPFPETF